MSGYRRKPSDPDPLEKTGSSERSPIVGERGLGERFHRDLVKAHRAFVKWRRELRHPPVVSTRREEVRTVPSSELVDRLKAGLRKEHDLVLWPLLDRLDAFAMRLERGEEVPPETIQEGLTLVNRYLHELHDVHLDLLALADADPKRGEPARLALDLLVADHEYARVRWATVHVMFRGYEQKVRGYRSLLSLTLAQECRAERAWHDFEERYVRTSVPPAFSAAVAERWQGDLDRSRDSGRADRGRIEEFVGRTTQYMAARA